MKFAVVRLAVAAVLFVGWIGYLGFLVAVTRHPIVLSRPQFLVSQKDVIATYKGNSTFEIDRVLYPVAADSGAEKGATLVVRNLKECEQYSASDDRWIHAAPAAELRYLLPLQTPAGPAPPDAKQADAVDVVPIPTASGAAGPPRIYPDTPEVERQYQAIRQNEPRP